MGSRIDKNDVDISKLFYYSDKFELTGKNGKKLPIYIRLVGDAELNQARVFALRESANLRKKLKNPNSDEYLAYIPDLDLYSKRTLIDNILLIRSQELYKDLLVTHKFNLPIEPKSTASLEEQEAYQEEVDNFDDKYEQELKQELQEKIKNEELILENLSEEELKKELLRLTINQICEYYMIERFRAMCVYFGTYKDANYRERLFSSFDEFDNLPKDIKEQLFFFYNKLEISEIELKK